jgi:hypothetical protein
MTPEQEILFYERFKNPEDLTFKNVKEFIKELLNENN